MSLKFRSSILCSMFVLCTVVAGGPAAAKKTKEPLNILCGVGLVKPMDELAMTFSDESGIKTLVSYGGSGELLGKLAVGGSYDILLPGAAQYIEDAARRGWVAASTRLDLVYHVPAIVVPADNPARIKNLQGLAGPGVRVALGDPEACAIGRAAENILERAGLSGRIKSRVRTAGASQLLLYLLMGQADAAIIWEDLAAWPKAKGKLKIIPIPEDIGAPRTIAAARVLTSKHPERADSFLSFLETERARDIWRKWGFKPCVE